MSEDTGVVLLSSNKKEREAYENYAGLQTQDCLCCANNHPHAESMRLRCFADLFAIFKTTEKLERAYVRDAISSKEYEPACQKLIGQYKTLWETLRDTVCASACMCLHTSCQPHSLQASTAEIMLQVPDVQQFLAHYNMQCPMAAKRLIQSGMPATLEHGKPRQGLHCSTHVQTLASSACCSHQHASSFCIIGVLRARAV